MMSSPASFAFPAHAGMNRNRFHLPAAVIRVPRTRGDEPYDAMGFNAGDLRSPHTRG